jgi:hypothetical protein
LLAPLRYLAIHHPEKSIYDTIYPLGMAGILWLVYIFIQPRIPLFGDQGLIKLTRDLLIMAVPFLVGALATVSMAGPGLPLDKRPLGADLLLDGEVLSLRQFVCYLLGYLSFIGFVTLGGTVFASILHDPIMSWTNGLPHLRIIIRWAGALVLSLQLSILSVTVFWALYFLTDIVNRRGRGDG